MLTRGMHNSREIDILQTPLALQDLIEQGIDIFHFRVRRQYCAEPAQAAALDTHFLRVG